MALESLLEDAFRRGCGISRSYALRTPRYKELLRSAPRVPSTTQAETAEMLYLGERLADRAFLNLPYTIRQKAMQWPSMTEAEQHALLDVLMKRLTTSEWLRIHGKERRATKTVSEVFPAECGSWSRGKHQPNCLGLTQLLIGFARATGAEHVMIDTVTRFEYYNEQLIARTCQTMGEMLAPYTSNRSIERLSKRIEHYRRGSLRILARMEQDEQAHHALAIKVGSTWIAVDPYMHRKYPMKSISRPHLDIYGSIMKAPRRHWKLFGAHTRDLDSKFTLEALTDVLALYDRRDEPVASSYDLIAAIHQAGPPLFWVGNYSEERALKKEIDEHFSYVAVVSLLTPAENKRWKKGTKAPKDVKQSVRKRYDLANRRKRERNAALIRLIRLICVRGLEAGYFASQGHDISHRRIEIGHPAFHLAIMTLNHVGHATRRPTAQLIRYDSSQWIIRDTLKEVMSSGDQQLIRIATSKLLKLKKYTHHVMPLLLDEITKREQARGTRQEER